MLKVLIYALSGLIFTCGKLIFDITQKSASGLFDALAIVKMLGYDSRYNVYIDVRAGVLT